MTIPTPTAPLNDQQIREHQSELLALLDDLVDMDLPPVTWTIPAGGHPCQLYGRVGSPISTAELDTEQVETWAKFLGAPIVGKDRRSYTEIYVRGLYANVPVEIWAYVTKAAAVMPEAEG